MVTLASPAHIPSLRHPGVVCKTPLHVVGCVLSERGRESLRLWVLLSDGIPFVQAVRTRYRNYGYSDSQFKMPFTTQLPGTAEPPATVQWALITCD